MTVPKPGLTGKRTTPPGYELRQAVLKLMGATVAAVDQAESMTDAELAALLLSGKWTTVEVHEAGRRLGTSKDRLFVNDERTVLVRLWANGTVEVARLLELIETPNYLDVQRWNRDGSGGGNADEKASQVFRALMREKLGSFALDEIGAAALAEIDRKGKA